MDFHHARNGFSASGITQWASGQESNGLYLYHISRQIVPGAPSPLLLRRYRFTTSNCVYYSATPIQTETIKGTIKRKPIRKDIKEG
jgi:hypothetical protein